MIPKDQLVVGAYYKGRGRTVYTGEARWDGQLFAYWREKWGARFVDTMYYPTDDPIYAVFTPEERVDNPIEEIPFD